MKKSLIVVVLSIFGWYESHAQRIEFKNETLHYGRIKMGSNGERVFKFKNSGDKPLILSNVSASCGCTTPKWSTNPVLPKESGKINVVYDTQRIGPFKKSVTIFSNAINTQRKIIYVEGEVVK
ncbi:DUF1573 domain-containing protein [Bacteroidetes bacterium endosymbiont of Geopemphigus sp.]|uniref:DUF1573 domain-containing protein n=1 Tax=Bacteroidetes bacterium endosymbiont of Geopemphigus sp. TaxID=2047937 RepID=UPI000CD1AE1F|nr:DUF1573 domain-containing protein [Bacteroidetes bacterium endosymbiont of Geopemphigus sp.]